jgi:hypothetical protein
MAMVPIVFNDMTASLASGKFQSIVVGPEMQVLVRPQLFSWCVSLEIACSGQLTDVTM